MIVILTNCVFIIYTMSARLILFFVFFLSSFALSAQRTRVTQVPKSPTSVANGVNSSGDKKIVTTSRKANGYIVYKGDTIKGLIMMGLDGVYLDHIQNNGSGKFYDVKFKDRGLKTIMMYNADNKPLCLTRVKESDKKLMRLLHEGKLTVYDDRIGYVYTPDDIDPFLVVVSYNGEVETLGSFSKGETRKDLIAYINDVYGLKIDYKTKWSELMLTMDGLD